MKPTNQLTEKQRYWLKHISAARTAGTALSVYAKKHQLKLKALHNWAWKFKKLGILAPAESKPFVKVVRHVKLPATSIVSSQTLALQIRFANDVQILMQVNPTELLSVLARVKAL